MATYQVMMTFEVPQVQRPRDWTITLPLLGRRPGATWSLRAFGGSGRMSVTGAVREESPADAAMVAVKAVLEHWDKSDGPIKIVSWTAHRERAFAGLGRRPGPISSSWNRPGGGLDGGWMGRGRDDDRGPDDEGGSAGVREPRRPLPGPGSMSAALELPRD